MRLPVFFLFDACFAPYSIKVSGSKAALLLVLVLCGHSIVAARYVLRTIHQQVRCPAPSTQTCSSPPNTPVSRPPLSVLDEVIAKLIAPCGSQNARGVQP